MYTTRSDIVTCIDISLTNKYKYTKYRCTILYTVVSPHKVVTSPIKTGFS